jgi:hypothetical protein
MPKIFVRRVNEVCSYSRAGEPQPAPTFLEALSALVGRWLLVRSTAPEMDAVTVLCKARGYIARHETTQTKGIERESR